MLIKPMPSGIGVTRPNAIGSTAMLAFDDPGPFWNSVMLMLPQQAQLGLGWAVPDDTRLGELSRKLGVTAWRSVSKTKR